MVAWGSFLLGQEKFDLFKDEPKNEIGIFLMNNAEGLTGPLRSYDRKFGITYNKYLHKNVVFHNEFFIKSIGFSGRNFDGNFNSYYSTSSNYTAWLELRKYFGKKEKFYAGIGPTLSLGHHSYMQTELQNFNSNALGYSSSRGWGMYSQAGMKAGIGYKISDRLSINLGIEGKGFTKYKGKMNNTYSFPISFGIAYKF